MMQLVEGLSKNCVENAAVVLCRWIARLRRLEATATSALPLRLEATATIALPWQMKATVARIFVALAILFIANAACDAQERKVILVVGASGTGEYTSQFETWADNWQAAIKAGGESNEKISVIRIGSKDPGDQTDADRLQSEIESSAESTGELWVVLIGHGTDDRETAKFNLRGPDVSATQLNLWLSPLPCRVVVINCASASGSFISKLKGKNRIVVTATKSGSQHNFARLGGYLASAIADPANDLDKDQQTSLLEAFLAASAQTQEFYVQETRLATELAMIDDNGDGLGTPADWFQGTRVVRKSKSGDPDGFDANQVFLVRGRDEAQLSEQQRTLRNELEQKLESLRLQKPSMTKDPYYQTIEPILIELATIYDSVSDAESNNVE